MPDPLSMPERVGTLVWLLATFERLRSAHEAAPAEPPDDLTEDEALADHRDLEEVSLSHHAPQPGHLHEDLEGLALGGVEEDATGEHDTLGALSLIPPLDETLEENVAL